MEPKKPEFKFSVRETSRKQQVPEPVEDKDFYKEDRFDCTVAFEIHVSGYEGEDEINIQSRAYEAIKKGGDLECLGVMMKVKNGTVCRDIDGKLFDRESWINQKIDEMKIQRKEKPIAEFEC